MLPPYKIQLFSVGKKRLVMELSNYILLNFSSPFSKSANLPLDTVVGKSYLINLFSYMKLMHKYA